MARLGVEQLEEARARLAQRSPDAAFTAAEAAIYTGRSTRTLKRAIDAGVGPRREKNPDVSGLGATNRHTRYRKADLDAWRESLVAFATAFRDFDALAMDAPWVVEGDRIVGHLLDLEGIGALLQALEVDAIVFLRLDEALGREWGSSQARQRYLEMFRAICRTAIKAAEASAQTEEIEISTGAATGEPRDPMRL